MNSLLQSLSLCKMAGKLLSGFDTVKESVYKGEAKFIVISTQMSAKTVKEAEYLSKTCAVPLIKIDSGLNELWYQLGRKSGIFSITDTALGQKVVKAASEQNKEDK